LKGSKWRNGGYDFIRCTDVENSIAPERAASKRLCQVVDRVGGPLAFANVSEQRITNLGCAVYRKHDHEKVLNGTSISPEETARMRAFEFSFWPGNRLSRTRPKPILTEKGSCKIWSYKFRHQNSAQVPTIWELTSTSHSALVLCCRRASQIQSKHLTGMNEAESVCDGPRPREVLALKTWLRSGDSFGADENGNVGREEINR
jgi:hypothetical protein